MNDCCFRLRLCTCKAILGQGQPNVTVYDYGELTESPLGSYVYGSVTKIIGFVQLQRCRALVKVHQGFHTLQHTNDKKNKLNGC